MTQEQLYAIALTQIHGVNAITAKLLYEKFGSATALFENRNDIRCCFPEATTRMVEALKTFDSYLRRAEKELEFVEKKNIKLLTLNCDSYPQRMKCCDDAPVVLYYCGNGELNKVKVVSMVGTRKCDEYGKELCRNFVEGLHRYYPDALIVSGLAYGIDIHSHRAALANGMETVGVLAHSLDRIYPSVHRQTAVEMVSHGGLISEYVSGTAPERYNFLARNRIIAGMADACVVVQSATKGGSLVTADISQVYNREVFAFPGRTNDEQSAGCNHLISNDKAHLITCAEDFIKIMGWELPSENIQKPLQQELFLDLTDDEQKIVDSLKKNNEQVIGSLINDTGLDYSLVSSLMFELEMKGVVKVLGGAKYAL